MGRAGSPPYIASSARMNERSGRSREGAGERREKREARERELLQRSSGTRRECRIQFGVQLGVCAGGGGWRVANHASFNIWIWNRT